MTAQGSPESRDIARQLLERETAGVTDVAALGAAMQRAYTRVSLNLRRSVGEDGYTALLARALSRAQREQPVLKDIRHVDASRIDLNVVAGVAAHGASQVRAALEALLTSIVDILGDLIGADMVRSLLDHDEPTRIHADRRIQ